MTSSTPTLRDVAAEAGVSPMTASNALRGKPGVKESTRAKVIAAAKKLNYRINLTASMLKSGRSNIIHVIVNEFDSPFYSKLTQALSNEIVSRPLNGNCGPVPIRIGAMSSREVRRNIDWRPSCHA